MMDTSTVVGLATLFIGQSIVIAVLLFRAFAARSDAASLAIITTANIATANQLKWAESATALQVCLTRMADLRARNAMQTGDITHLKIELEVTHEAGRVLARFNKEFEWEVNYLQMRLMELGIDPEPKTGGITP